AHFAVGNTAALRFAVLVGLDLQSFLSSFTVIRNLVEDNLVIPDWLTVALLEHSNGHGCVLRLFRSLLCIVVFLPGKRCYRNGEENQPGITKSAHGPYFTPYLAVFDTLVTAASSRLAGQLRPIEGKEDTERRRPWFLGRSRNLPPPCMPFRHPQAFPL